MPINIVPEALYPIGLAIGGAMLGATVADIDLAPPIPLRHRSAWTHGPFVPLALSMLAGPLWGWFTVGFLPAYTLHLLADMLPKKWQGGALVSWYPLGGWRMPAVLSLAWLALGVGVAGWVWWGFAVSWWPF